MDKRWPSGSSSSNVPSTSYNLRPFKDLVIFEERIRQNLANLHRMRRKLRYRILVLSLALFLLLLLHVRFVTLSAILTSPTLLTMLGLLLLYAALVTVIVSLCLSLQTWKNSPVKRYEDQCQKTLRHFNLQLTYGTDKELTFFKRLPRRLAELLEAFRVEFRARRSLQSNVGSKKSK